VWFPFFAYLYYFSIFQRSISDFHGVYIFDLRVLFHVERLLFLQLRANGSFFFVVILELICVFRPSWTSDFYEGHPWPSPFGPAFGCLNPPGADLVFACSKNTHQKNIKSTRILALRVPCYARLIRRNVKLAFAQTTHPEISGSI